MEWVLQRHVYKSEGHGSSSGRPRVFVLIYISRGIKDLMILVVVNSRGIMLNAKEWQAYDSSSSSLR